MCTDSLRLDRRSFSECIIGESCEEKEEVGEEFEICWRGSCWRGREEEK